MTPPLAFAAGLLGENVSTCDRLGGIVTAELRIHTKDNRWNPRRKQKKSNVKRPIDTRNAKVEGELSFK